MTESTESTVRYELVCEKSPSINDEKETAIMATQGLYVCSIAYGQAIYTEIPNPDILS